MECNEVVPTNQEVSVPKALSWFHEILAFTDFSYTVTLGSPSLLSHGPSEGDNGPRKTPRAVARASWRPEPSACTWS